MTNSKQKSNTNKNSNYGFRITSVRWYWWLLLIIIIYFIYAGICTVFGLSSGDGVLNKVSRSLLGLFGGLTNMVTHQWWFVAGIGIFAFTTATPAVIAWIGHFGKGKSAEEQNKEMKIDKANLQDLKEQNRDELENLSINEQVDLLKRTAVTNVTNDTLSRLHESYHERYMEATENSKQQIAEEYYDAVDDANKAQEESGGEPQDFLPIEEAP